jgi:hypothetical protein
MDGEPQMPCGLRGTAQFVDDAGQIGMLWDNGSNLSLVPEADSYRKLTPEELAEEVLDEQEGGLTLS